MKDEVVVMGWLGSAAIAYFAGKRKSKADASNSELEATGKAITIWRDLAGEYKKQNDELKKELNNQKIIKVREEETLENKNIKP